MSNMIEILNYSSLDEYEQDRNSPLIEDQCKRVLGKVYVSYVDGNVVGLTTCTSVDKDFVSSILRNTTQKINSINFHNILDNKMWDDLFFILIERVVENNNYEDVSDIIGNTLKEDGLNVYYNTQEDCTRIFIIIGSFQMIAYINAPPLAVWFHRPDIKKEGVFLFHRSDIERNKNEYNIYPPSNHEVVNFIRNKIGNQEIPKDILNHIGGIAKYTNAIISVMELFNVKIEWCIDK